MTPIDVIAVVGSCAPERRRAARRLAEEHRSVLVPAARLAVSPDPLAEALALVPWAYREGCSVVEFPTPTPMTELIGTLCEAEERARLVGITCVVDAAHLFDELRRDDYFVRYSREGETGSARALVAVEQIEFASTVLLVNWEPLSTPDLSTIMALVGHLSPHARLRLERGGHSEQPGEPVAFSAGQERPGWVGILNEDFDPHLTDPRVSSFRYEQLRPMHPGRLSALLDGGFARGAFGSVIRSAGFCRLASRPRVTAKWEHVGQMFSMHPLIADDEYEDDDEMLGFGQDIAFTGIDLDRPGLAAALDAAALTDAEFAAGPEVWAGFADPFPVSRSSAR